MGRKKEELSIFEQMGGTETKTFEDVMEMLKKIYLIDIRLKGNTISYAIPCQGI